MEKYLKYIQQVYSDFRFSSDKNVLENLEVFSEIHYEIISDSTGFCVIYNDLRISKNICFFGFLEIYQIGDSPLFLKKIIQRAKCIHNGENKKLVGPINFSIWNSYRFGSFHKNQQETILGEYDTSPHIHNYLLESDFQVYETYITAKRSGKNPYILKNNYTDYSIEKVEINDDTLKIIYDLSVSIFTQAPKISLEEFGLYMQVYIELYQNNISEFILTYQGTNIGFISSFYTNEYFAIKTVGILQEYRGQGLGNYLLSHVYEYYLDTGYSESYYLYMREEGDALKMTSEGAEKYREYYNYYINL